MNKEPPDIHRLELQRRSARVSLAALFSVGVVCAILFSILVLVGPSLLTIPLVLPGRPVFFVVPNAVIRPILLLLSVLIPILTVYGYAGMHRRGAGRTALLPLGLLPLAATLLLLPVPPLKLASSALLLLPAAFLAASFALGMTALRSRLDRAAPLVVAVGMMVVLAAFYTVLGTGFNRRFGETEVDEGHYLIQADSLIHDGDLDIKNNLDFDLEEAMQAFIDNHPERDSGMDMQAEAIRVFREHMHVSPKSPSGKWYSWHPFGLSILLAPTIPLGLTVRQFVLAMISVIGLAAAFLLCVRMGNKPTASLWVVLCTGLTLYWIAFTIRSLPEVLGASLLVMAYFAVHLYRDRPVAALSLFIPVCLFTPFAHPRFIAFTAVAVLMLVATVFSHSRHKRLLAWIGASLVGVALIVLFVSYRTYGGSLSSYPLHNLFFVYPEGAWLSYFSDRGLFYAFPFAIFLIAANAIAFFKDRPGRLFYGGALLSQVIYIAVFSTMDCWDAGPTMAGRYLLVMTLVLLPGGAWLLSRLGSVVRWWVTLPSALSFYMFIWSITHLQDVDKWWLKDPLLTLRTTLPRFSAAFDPFGDGEPLISILFLVSMLVFTFLIVLPLSRKRYVNAAFVAGFVAIAMFSDLKSNRKLVRDLNPMGVDWIVSRLHSPRIRFCRASKQLPAVEVFELSNRFDWFGSRTWSLLDDLAPSGRIVVLEPFSPVLERPALMRLTGSMSGDVKPTLILRQNERVYVCREITTDVDGEFDLYYQLEGLEPITHMSVEIDPGDAVGEITIDRICWSPMMEADWILLPECTAASADAPVLKEN